MKSLKTIPNDIDNMNEIEKLRLRLEEAEETLRAIREGEVDGLIVNSSQGEQVFTLIGADHSYRVLIEAMNEGALTLAADGTILYCNHSFTTMMKTPQQELIGSSFFNLLYPDDLYNLQVDIARNEGMARKEINLLRGDSSPLPVHFSMNSMMVEGIERLSLVITDLSEMKELASELKLANNQLRQEITERKEAEKALRQSEQKAANILESISDAFYALDREWRFTYANKEMLRQFNIQDASEIIGQVIWEAFPNYTDYTYEMFHKAVAEQTSVCYESSSKITERWHYVHAYPSPDGLSVYFLDITERKQAEKAIRQSEEKFFKSFHSSPVMMAIVKKKDNSYIDVNDSWLKAFGLTRDKVLGHTHLELNLWADLKDFYEKGLLLERDKSLNNYEISFINIKGETRTGLASSEAIYMGEMICFLHTMIDITEQKRMEKEFARLDRLNLIGEMAASIGHEIRNPMTAIRGFLQMLSYKDEYANDLMFFDLMIEELDRANEIISEYLGMAKDKRVDLQYQYLDQVVKALYPILMADANYQEKEISLYLSKPPMPLIDEKEIRQLILNMARNGLEAMPAGGTLTIGTMFADNEIVLFIKDEGQGIPLSMIDKLGTPFFTTKENGTGLGLAVCYSIAARHNARIDLKTGSEGTTFYVRFPLPVEQTLLF